MKHQSGFSLIEVTLALGLSAFCLTTLMGLIPAGLRSARNSDAKCSASDIATLLISDLQNVTKGKTSTGTNQTVDGVKVPEAGDASSATATQTIYYSEKVANVGSNHFSTTPTKDSLYQLSVTMQPPATNQHGATNVWIRVTWPAMSKASAPEGTLEVFTALNRN